MITITYKKQLLDLAKKLGVRDDWHEPDEEDVSAKVFGEKFDNAGFYGLDAVFNNLIKTELFVVLYHEDKPVAQIALATLFAFACDTYDG